MLTQEFLPEGLVARCLDILRKLSASERDLILVVVEVVQELRDFGRDVEDDEVRSNYLFALLLGIIHLT